jgi:hypothetical protein
MRSSRVIISCPHGRRAKARPSATVPPGSRRGAPVSPGSLSRGDRANSAGRRTRSPRFLPIRATAPIPSVGWEPSSELLTWSFNGSRYAGPTGPKRLAAYRSYPVPGSAADRAGGCGARGAPPGRRRVPAAGRRAPRGRGRVREAAPLSRRAAAVIGGGVSRFDCVRDALLRVGHAGLPQGPAVGAQYPGWARAAGVSASPTASTSSVIS